MPESIPIELKISPYDVIDLNYPEIKQSLEKIFSERSSFIPPHLLEQSIFQCWTREVDLVNTAYETYCLAQQIRYTGMERDIAQLVLPPCESLIALDSRRDEAVEFIIGNENVAALAGIWLPQVNHERQFTHLTNAIFGLTLKYRTCYLA